MKTLLVPLLTSLALAACSGDTSAQNPPKGSFRLIPKTEVTQEMRALYESNTVRGSEAFLRVAMSEDYVHLIASARSWPFPRSPRVNGLGPFRAETQIDEDPHRTTTIFAESTGARLMVTANNFAADGTRLTVPEERINVHIGTRPGVLALASSPGSNAGLWKLTFFSQEVMCEVYVEDTLSASQQPTRTPASIIALAELALPLCDTQH